jgi:TP901 family phage tail tape measure protein
MARGMGIAGKDSMAFADAIQRVSYAAGLKLPEIKESMKYMGSSLKQLGVEGMGNSKTVLAMMGALRQSNVEGSQIGTTFQGAFEHMATMAARLKSGRGEIMKEAEEAMKASGVKLNFFDKDGKFLGMENFADQFDKLKGISEEKRLMLGKALFGSEGSKMALLDSSKLRDMTRGMLQQESIEVRLGRITGTLGAATHAATGSFTNFLATIGEKVAPMLLPVLGKLNDILGVMQSFVDKHPKLVGALAGTVGGLGLLAVASGGALWGFGKILTAGAESIQTFKLIGGVAGTAAKGVIGLGKDFGYCVKNASSLREGIGVFAQTKFPAWLTGGGGLISKAAGGFKAFSLATWGTVKALVAQAAAWAMTPWGMITIGIVAVAAGAILLWRNWDKVAGWFKGAWSWFQGLWAQVPGWVKWMVPFLAIPMAIIQNWGRIRGFFGGLWSFISGMVGKFRDAGKNIATAIWEGIKSSAMKPVEAIKGIVTKIRRFLPFSPAKEGPLMDIHRIKLVETIAEGIKPGAILGKMGQLARVMVPTLALAVPGGAAGARAVPGGAFGARGGINLKVEVNVQGGSAQDGRKLAQEMMPEIIRQLEVYQDQKASRSHR